MFALHPQLQQDCQRLGRFELCQLLLMNDANYPWFILVPERVGVCEIYQMSEPDQQQLWCESARLSEALMQIFQGDKMNVAALGNVVPQLHIHHIVRYRNDIAWAAPVWGKVAARPYSDSERGVLLEKIFAHPLWQSGFERQA